MLPDEIGATSDTFSRLCMNEQVRFGENFVSATRTGIQFGRSFELLISTLLPWFRRRAILSVIMVRRMRRRDPRPRSRLRFSRVPLCIFDLSCAAYDTREVLCAFDASGGADYGGLIIDDDKNLTRKMFCGENSENTRATYEHDSRL